MMVRVEMPPDAIFYSWWHTWASDRANGVNMVCFSDWVWKNGRWTRESENRSRPW